MQFRLRTLLILLAVLPPLGAAAVVYPFRFFAIALLLSFVAAQFCVAATLANVAHFRDSFQSLAKVRSRKAVQHGTDGSPVPES